jgi:hypothetical protein
LTTKRKRSRPTRFAITTFFNTNPHKYDEMQQKFLEILMSYICKGYRALSTYENIWLWRYMLMPLWYVSFSLGFGGRKCFLWW